VNFETIQQICTARAAVSEEFPFDEHTLVWKVAGKMFCLMDIRECSSLGLKGDPDRIVEWREQYEQIGTGPYLNSKHWMLVHLEGLSPTFVQSLIEHSYDCVVRKLPKAQRLNLEQQNK
jgi:predicted DNA-binding protein (MmcQ/YjbR family)